MAGPWEQFQTQPQAPAAGPWTQFQQTPGSVDLRRAPVIDDVTWFRQTYGRDPISADQAGTNDPASFRRTFGFDPVGPQAPNGALGEDPFALRAQMDPEGAAAYQASNQSQLRQESTGDWNADNLIPISGPGQFLRRAVNSATLGWSDELAGLLGGNTEQERQLLQGFEVANPMAARAADLVGGAATAVIPGGAIARGATTAGRVARGAAAGAGVGAVAGAGYSDANTFAGRAQGALSAAIPSSIIGGAIPVVAPAVARSLRGLIPERAGTRAALPTTEEMRAGASAAYQRADDAGLAVGQGQYQSFALDAYERMVAEGLPRRPEIAQALFPRATALTDLVLLEAGRQAHSLTDLEQLRRVIGRAAGATDPGEQHLAQVLRDQVDDWLDGLTPEQVLAGNPQEAVGALRQARELWSRMRKTEIIENIENRAEIRANANYTSAGIETALRQEFATLAKNQRQMARFTPEEQEAIRAVAVPGGVQNVLRRLGAFAPRGFFSTALGVLGASSGNPAMMGLTAVGEGSRRLSDMLTRRRVGEVNSVIRRGADGPAPEPAGTQALIRALTSANLSQTPQGTQQLVPDLMRLLGGGQPLPVR